MKKHILIAAAAVLLAAFATQTAHASVILASDKTPAVKSAPAAEDPGPSPRDEAAEDEEDMPVVEGKPSDSTDADDEDTRGDEE